MSCRSRQACINLFIIATLLHHYFSITTHSIVNLPSCEAAVPVSIALSPAAASDYFLRVLQKVTTSQPYTFRAASSANMLDDAVLSQTFSMLIIDPTSTEQQDIHLVLVDPKTGKSVTPKVGSIVENVNSITLNVVFEVDTQTSDIANDIYYDSTVVTGYITVERNVRVGSFLDEGPTDKTLLIAKLDLKEPWSVKNAMQECRVIRSQVALFAGFLDVYASPVQIVFSSTQPLVSSKPKPGTAAPTAATSASLIYIVDCQPGFVVSLTTTTITIYMAIWTPPFAIGKWFDTEIASCTANDFVVTNTRIVIATSCGVYATPVSTLLYEKAPFNFTRSADNIFNELIFTPYCDCPVHDSYSEFDMLLPDESSPTTEKRELVMGKTASGSYYYSFTPFDKWRVLAPAQMIRAGSDSTKYIAGVNAFINRTITDVVYTASYDPWHQVLSVVYRDSNDHYILVGFPLIYDAKFSADPTISAITYDSALFSADEVPTPLKPTRFFVFRNNLFISTEILIYSRMRQCWMKVFDATQICADCTIITLQVNTINNEVIILISNGLVFALDAGQMQVHRLSTSTPLLSNPGLNIPIMHQQNLLAAFLRTGSGVTGATSNGFFDVVSKFVPSRERLDTLLGETTHTGLLFQPMGQQRAIFYGVRKTPVGSTLSNIDIEFITLDSLRMTSVAMPSVILRDSSNQRFYFSYFNHVLESTEVTSKFLSAPSPFVIGNYFNGFLTQKTQVVDKKISVDLQTPFSIYPIRTNSKSPFTTFLGGGTLTVKAPNVFAKGQTLLIVADLSSIAAEQPDRSPLGEWRFTAMVIGIDVPATEITVVLLPYPNFAPAMAATESSKLSGVIIKRLEIVDFILPVTPISSVPLWSAEIDTSCAFLLNFDTVPQLALHLADFRQIKIQLWRSSKDFDQLIRYGGLIQNFDGALMPALYLVTPGGFDAASIDLSLEFSDIGSPSPAAIAKAVDSSAVSRSFLQQMALVATDDPKAAAGMISIESMLDVGDEKIADDVLVGLIGGADASNTDDMLNFLSFNVEIIQSGLPSEIYRPAMALPSKLDFRLAPRNRQCQIPRRHVTATAAGSTNVWVKSGCPRGTNLHFQFPIVLDSKYYTRANSLFITENQMEVMHDIPSNYRPPGKHGTSLYSSTNVYNVDPQKPIATSFGINYAPYQLNKCASAASRDQCNCDVEALMSESITGTDCIARAYRVSLAKDGNGFTEKLPLSFTLDDSTSSAAQRPNFIMWIEELNRRDGWYVEKTSVDIVLDMIQAAYYAYEVDTSYLGESSADDRATRQLAVANGDVLTFDKQGLFHFRATVMQNFSFCNLKTEFIVFTVDQPLQYPAQGLIQFLILVIAALILFLMLKGHGRHAIVPWKTGSRQRPMEMPFKTQMRMQSAQLDEKTKRLVDKEVAELAREYNAALYEAKRAESRQASAMSFMRPTRSFVH